MLVSIKEFVESLEELSLISAQGMRSVKRDEK